MGNRHPLSLPHPPGPGVPVVGRSVHSNTWGSLLLSPPVPRLPDPEKALETKQLGVRLIPSAQVTDELTKAWVMGRA